MLGDPVTLKGKWLTSSKVTVLDCPFAKFQLFIDCYAYKNCVTGKQALQTQIDKCRGFAERAGLEIVGVYADLHTRSRREELLRECEKGNIHAIIVSSYDRIERAQEQFYRIAKKLQQHDVKLYFADGTFGTNCYEYFFVSEYFTDILTRRK